MFNVERYWDDRYKSGGTSGRGNEGDLGRSKAALIAAAIATLQPVTILDLGCGDGSALARINLDVGSALYTGVDVSQAAVNRCRNKFADRQEFEFRTMDERAEWAEHRYELGLSLDVIYHLVDDNAFRQYMRDLTSYASRWLLIYSSNYDGMIGPSWTRPRKFSAWIALNAPSWKLVDKIDGPEGSDSNLYRYDRSPAI